MRSFFGRLPLKIQTSIWKVKKFLCFEQDFINWQTQGKAYDTVKIFLLSIIFPIFLPIYNTEAYFTNFFFYVLLSSKIRTNKLMRTLFNLQFIRGLEIYTHREISLNTLNPCVPNSAKCTRTSPMHLCRDMQS